MFAHNIKNLYRNLLKHNKNNFEFLVTSIETFDFDKWKNDGNKTKWKTSKINLLSQNFNHFAITVNSLFTSSEKQNKQKVFLNIFVAKFLIITRYIS